MNNICIDFGGTEIKIGFFINEKLFDFLKYKNTTKDGIEDILFFMKEKIEQRLEILEKKISDFHCVSIAMPGLVNSKNKTVISINDKYNTSVNFDFSNWFKTNMNLPIFMENDANAALLGEIALGTAEDASYVGLYIFGTGVGTAMAIDGNIYRGAHNQGGCLGGHFTVSTNGNKCTCGSVGCVEAQASTWALKKIKGESFGFKELLESVNNGNEEDIKIFNDFIDYWASGLTTFIHAYDPHVIILSGGIIKAGDKLIKPLINKVNSLVWSTYGEPKFVISENPQQSVLYGLDYVARKEKIL